MAGKGKRGQKKSKNTKARGIQQQELEKNIKYKIRGEEKKGE